MTVVDQRVEHSDANWEYDLWRVQTVHPNAPQAGAPRPPEEPVSRLPGQGGDLYIAWGGRVDIEGTGLAEGGSDVDPPPGDGTAAGWGDLAGRLRAEELSAEEPLDHALFITIPCVDRRLDPMLNRARYVYPARKAGNGCEAYDDKPGVPDLDEAKAPPTGSLFWLEVPTETSNNYPIKPWKRTILWAMHEYGMYVGDTGSKYYFTLETESGNQYHLDNHRLPITDTAWNTGRADPWWGLGDAAGWEPWDDDPSVGRPELNGADQLIGKLYWNSRDNEKWPDGTNFDWYESVWKHLKLLDPCEAKGNCIG